VADGSVLTVVIGLGIDAVDVARFRRAVERSPRLLERVFVVEELDPLNGRADHIPALAARFAAREATMKALGTGLGGIDLRDVWVKRGTSGEPVLRVGGRAAELASRRGITQWFVSLSHTRDLAVAVVTAA